MSIIVEHDLVFNNELVGKRILCKFPDRVSLQDRTFDVHLSDYELILDDFKLNPIEGHKNDTIYLKESGSTLIPIGNYPPADELTYSTFAVFMGYGHMKDADTDLKILFNKYNKQMFCSQIPVMSSVCWNKRLTSKAGVCKVRRESFLHRRDISIELSPHYIEKFPEEFTNVLVHEMIHAFKPSAGHGAEFLRLADDLNRRFGLDIRVYSFERSKISYVYECVNCGKTYNRSRRMSNLKNKRCGVPNCDGSIVLAEDNSGVG